MIAIVEKIENALHAASQADDKEAVAIYEQLLTVDPYNFKLNAKIYL